MAEDQPGFWEQNGYHDRGDPWREQRYQGDDWRWPPHRWRRAATAASSRRTGRPQRTVRLRVARRREAAPPARAALPGPACAHPTTTPPQRSYSLASDTDDPLLELLIERQPDGEVSEFLADVAEVGDVLELRGPIGRWFVWDTRTPVLCLVGGTGVVPAVAMARTARRVGSTDLLRIGAMAGDRRLPRLCARAGALRRHDGVHPRRGRRPTARPVHRSRR